MAASTAGQAVTVFGAYGHTGRFVVAELLARGYVPVLSGRDADRLHALAEEHAGLDVRPATVEDPAALDRALAGVAAVVNCAGPFAATTGPVVEAALRAGIPYVDVAAEIEALDDTFRRFADAGTVVLPGMAFFGGLGDLLATAALDGLPAADEVHIAYGLDSWHPTAGTRAAGAVSRERRAGRKVRFTGGRLEYHDAELPTLEWPFPEPLGTRAVVGEFTMADVVTVSSHLDVPEVCTYMAVEAAREVIAPDTPAPSATDDDGRSAQTFLVDVLVRAGGRERRAVARGRDIYAVTAPLAVEALDRILTGRTRTTGTASAGRLFDAADFLTALTDHLTVEYPAPTT
ncbi:saccharopine dehydrogenase NADP-binding domain-containing protein [Kitasatospora sp. NPDC048365]|uniref:saccharopine dehydrogenase NADP-binding domain-containing protein n=1 Tax=Kitasatospora sp. NPDC048365 TaxID=3364050 RepID=UPI00371491EF